MISAFAELGARISTTGGAIDHVEKTFRRRQLAVLVGWVLVLAIALAFAPFVPLKSLASATSLAILIVFACVNATLGPGERSGSPRCSHP